MIELWVFYYSVGVTVFIDEIGDGCIESLCLSILPFIFSVWVLIVLNRKKDLL